MKIRSEGSLEKRGESWRGVVRTGKDPITGKWKKVYRNFGKCTERQANKKLVEWLRELNSGLRVDADKITFAEYANDWQAQREAAQEVAPGTLIRDRSTIKRLCSYFGERAKVCELDVASIKGVYKMMRDDGVSENCIHQANMKLNQILKVALDDGLIIRNPCDRVKVRKPKPQKERRSLSKEEAARLAALTDGTDISDSRLIAVRIGLATGARRGEVLGLSWKHVDFERGAVRIERQYTHEEIFGEPKTKAGRRTVSLDRRTLEILAAWKEAQARYLFEELWQPQKDETPIINDAKGGYMNPDNFSRWFRGFCIANRFGFYEGEGFIPLTFHELRHTQATQLLGSRRDIVTVQTRLGHSKPSVTMDIYSHAIPQNDREAAEFIGSLLDASNLKPKVVNL